MKILFVHTAEKSFAGAERMLQYYTSALDSANAGHELITCAEPSFMDVLPRDLPVHRVAKTDESFGIAPLMRFGRTARRLHRANKFDLVHAWHARGWDVGAWIGKVCGLPVVGTLHDHPAASFLSAKRLGLMKLSAKFGFARVICVSEAVRKACVESGYPVDKLRVIRNGLPPSGVMPPPSGAKPLRLGFLGIFSERKGFEGLFQALAKLAETQPDGWTLSVAGDAPDEACKAILERVRAKHAAAAWWPRVQFVGWVKNALAFLQDIDLLIVPSIQFDPFPTVLLEAAQASRPVLASRVGGVSEIVDEAVTGWTFGSGDWDGAALRLGEIVRHPEKAAAAGGAASGHVRRHFTVEKMCLEHQQLYLDVLRSRLQ